MMNDAGVQDLLARAGITFFERGWLSANNVLIQGGGPTALVDSGYGSHALQTQALIAHALGMRPLDLLLNTHLHSDHCGGNAVLQARYPNARILIPPGLADAVEHWDTDALTYAPTGQQCPRFRHHGLLMPGTEHVLGSLRWQVHGAKGHDPHAIVLFQPETRILISADALWENGFGVVFPELEGIQAFDEVAETLDLIEALNPVAILPGHGGIFVDVDGALSRARSRLESFRQSPAKHHRHAIKVLVKFRLLEWQNILQDDLLAWARQTPYLRNAMPNTGDDNDWRQWMFQLLVELDQGGAIKMRDRWICNC